MKNLERNIWLETLVITIVVEKICELTDIERGECTEMKKVLEENKKVRHVIWMSEKPIPTDMPLEEVLKYVKTYQAVMTPIIENDYSSQWMQVAEKILPHIRKLIGVSPYKAHEGVNVALNQVYYVKIKGQSSDGSLVIENPPEPGQKKKVKKVEAEVEPDLIYPLIRGRDVKKWYVNYRERYIVLPIDSNGNILSHSTLKVNYPKAWKYFWTFFNDLINRGGEPYKSKLAVYRVEKFETAEKKAPPFY